MFVRSRCTCDRACWPSQFCIFRQKHKTKHTALLLQVYDAGSVFDPKILDITDSDLEATVQSGIKRIAAACLALNYPTLASIPHSVVNGYKNVLAVSVETDYTFPLAEKVCPSQNPVVGTWTAVMFVVSQSVLFAQPCAGISKIPSVSIVSCSW